MKKVNVTEYNSWTETLEWLGQVWVCDPPTVLRIWTAEAEKSKFFYISLPSDVLIKESLIEESEYLERIVPSTGVIYIILDNADSLESAVPEPLLPLNPLFNDDFLEEIGISVKKEISDNLREETSLIKTETDGAKELTFENSASSRVVLIRVPRNKMHIEIVGYEEGIKELLLNIERSILQKLSIEE